MKGGLAARRHPGQGVIVLREGDNPEDAFPWFSAPGADRGGILDPETFRAAGLEFTLAFGKIFCPYVNEEERFAKVCAVETPRGATLATGYIAVTGMRKFSAAAAFYRDTKGQSRGGPLGDAIEDGKAICGFVAKMKGHAYAMLRGGQATLLLCLPFPEMLRRFQTNDEYETHLRYLFRRGKNRKTAGDKR